MIRKQIFQTGLIFIIYFLIGLENINAQSASDRAQAYYFEAATAFENRNYQKAIDYCQEVENILGNSNARLEVLRLKSYYALGNATKAKNSLTNFYNYNSDESLKREVANYIVKIEEKEEYERTHTTCGRCYGVGSEEEKIRCSSCEGYGRKSYAKDCSYCNGKGGRQAKIQGQVYGTKWENCIMCGGEGKNEYNREYYDCSSCYGSGSSGTRTKTCPTCNGKGDVRIKH